MKVSFQFVFLVSVLVLLLDLAWGAFQGSNFDSSQRRRATFSRHPVSSASNFRNGMDEDDGHFLLKKFSTASGEIVNPYRVLQVARSAERKEVRAAYIRLSKRYHPDGVRHRDVLPGSW